MENPEYKIARLEADLRGARERADKLEVENRELTRQRDESDEMRSAMVSASTDLAFDTVVALGRIEALTVLADAAVGYKHAQANYAALPSPQTRDAAAKARLKLSRLTDAYESSKARRS